MILAQPKNSCAQVQGRMWPCGLAQHKSMCNCGVAVRENRDVIVMDMCGGRFKRSSLQISMKSQLPLAKGTEITKANNGKRYTVRLSYELTVLHLFNLVL